MVLLLLAALGAAGPGRAACPPRDPGVDVAVGVRMAPPFVMADPVRGTRGLTYDLWAAIERELRSRGLVGRTALVDCPLGAQLEALADGRLDLVISPLTITAERLERFDFTHQYLSSGLTVAQRSDGAIDFGYAAGILRDTFAHDGVPRAVLIFLVANLVLAFAVARELRHGEARDVLAREALPLRLCRYGLETVVRTIGLAELGEAGRSTAARVVEVFIAMVGAVLSATVFGLLTTALVGSMAGERPVALKDLPRHRVATLADSTSQAFLEEVLGSAGATAEDRRTEPASARGRREADPVRCVPAAEAGRPDRCVATESWQEAMELLTAGRVDLVLGDWAQLSYLSRLPDFAGRIGVQSTVFRLEPYGWGVSRRRPELRIAVDRALMARVRSTEWRFVVQEYMGSGSISPE